MATDIKLGDLTNGSLNTDNEWIGNGVFDKLIAAVNKNIESQYRKGRINASDFAKVYLGGIQSVIAQSMQYILQEKQVEAQVDLTNTQRIEAELNGLKDRSVKDAQIANLQKDLAIKDATLLKLQKETSLIAQQLTELALNGVKDRAIKDEQIANLQKDLEVKDASKGKTIKEAALVEAQTAEVHPNNVATREVKNADTQVKTAQVELLAQQKQSLQDGLLKDILKEASGGYAMVYEAVDTQDIPGTWADFDGITNELLARAGSSVVVTPKTTDSTT